jgi:hypothetical protein
MTNNVVLRLLCLLIQLSVFPIRYATYQKAMNYIHCTDKSDKYNEGLGVIVLGTDSTIQLENLRKKTTTDIPNT